MTEEQITRLYGPRCTEHCDDCCVCEVWAMHDRIEKLEADNVRLNDALRQSVMDAAEWARKAGEAQGKLEISEAAGILDGWKRDCERLRADNARLREALETIAAECCIPMGTDKQMYARWRALAASRVDVARAALAKRGLEVWEIEG